jgi:hypothetical protein
MLLASSKEKKADNKRENKMKITLEQYSSIKNSQKTQKASFKSLHRIINSTIVKNFQRKTLTT